MKKFIVMLTVAISLFAPLGLAPAMASAVDPFSSSEAKKQACAGINGCDGGNSLDKVIIAVINILSVVAGIASVIMIMISGFKYITSGGDSGKINSAKTTLIYAIVGIIVVAMAQFIAQFVINRVAAVPSQAVYAYVLTLT